jgi:hypothetical protein
MHNTSKRGMHTHNNGVCGVRNIDRVQRNFVGARNVSKCYHVTV